jgi:hypothetical protein
MKINAQKWIELSSQLHLRLKKLIERIGSTGYPEPHTNACNTWSYCAELIMALTLPPDFKEFVKLLKEHDVRYLMIGGYFDECYQARIVDHIDGVEVNLIDLEQLKKNKRTSGRAKGMADIENCPDMVKVRG